HELSSVACEGSINTLSAIDSGRSLSLALRCAYLIGTVARQLRVRFAEQAWRWCRPGHRRDAQGFGHGSWVPVAKSYATRRSGVSRTALLAALKVDVKICVADRRVGLRRNLPRPDPILSQGLGSECASNESQARC